MGTISNRKDCIEYICSIRWPNSFICLHCHQMVKAWTTSRGLFHCSKCRHDTSITAGAVFENTQKSLRLWFHVMWLMMAQKTGVSAKNLKDSMGFGSYQTIWGWLHKLRRVMVRPGREQLSGSVEVDETYIGGKNVVVKPTICNYRLRKGGPDLGFFHVIPFGLSHCRITISNYLPLVCIGLLLGK